MCEAGGERAVCLEDFIWWKSGRRVEYVVRWVRNKDCDSYEREWWRDNGLNFNS